MTTEAEIRQRDEDVIARIGTPERDPLLRAEMDRRWLLGEVDRLRKDLADAEAEGYAKGHNAALAYVNEALHSARAATLQQPKEPEPVLDLEPDEFYDIRGRGPVFVYKKGSLPKGIYEPDQLNGKQVRVDGRLYLVRGVERHAIPLGTPERPYTHAFGLLVRPLPDEPKDET